MAFERFNYTRLGLKGSIWKNGQFVFGKGVTKQFNLRSFEFMACFFDKDAQVIGFKPLEEEDEDECFRLHDSCQDGAVRLSFKPFLEFYGIDFSKTRNFALEWDDELKMIILDLKAKAD